MLVIIVLNLKNDLEVFEMIIGLFFFFFLKQKQKIKKIKIANSKLSAFIFDPSV